MNSVNLLAALSLDPTSHAENGEQMVVAEVFLRPNHERDRRDYPDRMRVVALGAGQAGVVLSGLKKGSVIAVSGCLRCSEESGFRLPEVFAERLTAVKSSSTAVVQTAVEKVAD